LNRSLVRTNFKNVECGKNRSAEDKNSYLLQSWLIRYSDQLLRAIASILLPLTVLPLSCAVFGPITSNFIDTFVFIRDFSSEERSSARWPMMHANRHHSTLAFKRVVQMEMSSGKFVFPTHFFQLHHPIFFFVFYLSEKRTFLIAFVRRLA
jgi:hypothetical protein